MSAGVSSARARPALRTATPVAVWLLCVVQLLAALAWSVTVPILRAPDEPAHVDLARHVASGAGYPDPGDKRVSAEMLAAGRVARFSAEPAARPDRDVRFRAGDAIPRRARPSFAALAGSDAPSRVPNQMSQHPPLYYAAAAGVLALAPETAPYDVQVWLLRALGALIVAPLPWLAWAAARWLVADQRAALAAATMPLTIPMLAHIGAAAGNDGLLAMLGGVFAVGLARLAAGDPTWRTGLVLGLSAGLGLLVKAFALSWLVALPVAVVVAVRSGRVRPPPAAWCGGLAAALAGLVGGWWYVRNLVRFGGVQPTLGPFPEVVDGPDVGEWLVLAASRLPLRFWGQFGWVEVALPWPVVWLATAGVVVAVVAALAARRAPAVGFRGPGTALLTPLVATAAVVLIGAARLYAVSEAPVGLQGRYLYGGVAGLAVVAGVGSAALAGRWARWLPVGLLGVATALHLLGGWLSLRHWWGPADPGTPVAALRSLLAWSPVPPSSVAGLGLVSVLSVLAAGVALARQGRTVRATSARGADRA